MKSITRKDITFYAIIAGVGLLVIWLAFGTNIIIDHGESVDSKIEEGSGEQVQNNFSKFNSTVPKKDVTNTDDKTVLLNEELEAEKKLAELKRKEEDARGVTTAKLDDVSAYMQRNTKKENNIEVLPTKAETNSQPQNQEASTQRVATTNSKTSIVNSAPIKKQSVTQQTPKDREPQVRKRKRNVDPSFDDQSQRSTASSNSNLESNQLQAHAIVHGDQSVVAGSRVIIRITEDFHIDGCIKIDANSTYTGNVTAGNEQRLMIKFHVTCESGKKLELNVYDATDGEMGLYIDSQSDEEGVGKDLTRDVVSSGSQAAGIPVIGRAISGMTSKKLNSKRVKLDSGRKLFVQVAK